jgi:hypothetical protein
MDASAYSTRADRPPLRGVGSRSGGRGRQPGWMFLLWWKTLSGSYSALTSASRR